MPSTNINIFQNILNNENQITEALANYLRFKMFRNHFIERFLPDLKPSEVEAEDISTQENFGKFIPDMVFSNDKHEIFFEVKVGDAPLQNTQTSAYLAHLLSQKEINSKEIKLYYIIPEDYHELETIKQYQKSNSDHVEIIFWHQIIKLIQDKEYHKISVLFNEFYTYLKYWFEPRKITFTIKQLDAMYNAEIPAILLNLFEVIEQVKNKLASRSDIMVSKTKTSVEHGFYVRDKDGNQLFFFGIWYSFWKEHNAPLVINIDPNQAVDSNVEAFKLEFPDGIEYQKWLNHPIPKSEFDENLISTLTKKLNNLLKAQLNNTPEK